MPIYFNITEARNHLLKNKVVYTLRKRKRRYLGKCQILKGSFRNSELIGNGRVSFIKSINNNDELLPYVKQSGFEKLKDWRKKQIIVIICIWWS